MDPDNVVIIRDESFPALIAEFLSQQKPGAGDEPATVSFDAVLSCGGTDAGVPVHRVVLGSVSDFLADIFREFESYDELSILLEDMDIDVLKLIVSFAYTGEASIPATSADDVYEASQRLGIKFLKDSFVRLDHQDYEDIRTGKKTLDMTAATSTEAEAAAVAHESSDTESAESPDNRRIGNESGVLLDFFQKAKPCHSFIKLISIFHNTTYFF